MPEDAEGDWGREVIWALALILVAVIAYVVVPRRPALCPGPYALGDPQQDGPPWRPTEEEFAEVSAKLKAAMDARTDRDQARTDGALEAWGDSL